MSKAVTPIPHCRCAGFNKTNITRGATLSCCRANRNNETKVKPRLTWAPFQVGICKTKIGLSNQSGIRTRLPLRYCLGSSKASQSVSSITTVMLCLPMGHSAPQSLCLSALELFVCCLLDWLDYRSANSTFLLETHHVQVGSLLPLPSPIAGINCGNQFIAHPVSILFQYGSYMFVIIVYSLFANAPSSLTFVLMAHQPIKYSVLP